MKKNIIAPTVKNPLEAYKAFKHMSAGNNYLSFTKQDRIVYDDLLEYLMTVSPDKEEVMRHYLASIEAALDPVSYHMTNTYQNIAPERLKMILMRVVEVCQKYPEIVSNLGMEPRKTCKIKSLSLLTLDAPDNSLFIDTIEKDKNTKDLKFVAEILRQNPASRVYLFNQFKGWDKDIFEALGYLRTKPEVDDFMATALAGAPLINSKARGDLTSYLHTTKIPEDVRLYAVNKIFDHSQYAQGKLIEENFKAFLKDRSAVNIKFIERYLNAYIGLSTANHLKNNINMLAEFKQHIDSDRLFKKMMSGDSTMIDIFQKLCGEFNKKQEQILLTEILETVGGYKKHKHLYPMAVWEDYLGNDTHYNNLELLYQEGSEVAKKIILEGNYYNHIADPELIKLFANEYLKKDLKNYAPFESVYLRNNNARVEYELLLKEYIKENTVVLSVSKMYKMFDNMSTSEIKSICALFSDRIANMVRPDGESALYELLDIPMQDNNKFLEYKKSLPFWKRYRGDITSEFMRNYKTEYVILEPGKVHYTNSPMSVSPGDRISNILKENLSSELEFKLRVEKLMLSYRNFLASPEIKMVSPENYLFLKNNFLDYLEESCNLYVKSLKKNLNEDSYNKLSEAMVQQIQLIEEQFVLAKEPVESDLSDVLKHTKIIERHTSKMRP